MSIEAAPRPAVTTDVVERMTALAPGFRARTQLTEAQRSVPRESIDELVAAGVARLLVPAEYGGMDLGLRDLVEVVAAAAAGCGATGWLAAQMAHHPHIVGMFPAVAQEAVWADGPDVVIASSTAPAGRAIPVPGGYRVTGRHTFASGVNNATWTFVGAMVPAPDGPPEWRMFLFGKDDYTIDDVWNTAGMRGTGSNTVVVDDLFVPEEFTLAQVDVREGRSPGALTNRNPKFGLPWNAFSVLGFTATMLGAVEGAYAAACETLRAKRTPAKARVAEGQVLQTQISLISAKIDTARMLLLGIADRADAARHYTLTDRAEVSRNNTFASLLLIEAIDSLVDISGTGAFGADSLLQQVWRDVHFASAHISMNRTETLGRHGRIELAVEETSTQGFF